VCEFVEEVWAMLGLLDVSVCEPFSIYLFSNIFLFDMVVIANVAGN
jgi:hypothetical protein